MIIEIKTAQGSRSYDLDSFGKGRIAFGRGSGCDIRIPVDFVSREHGFFQKINNFWHITDNNSTNGIIKNYVSGQKAPRRISDSPLDDNLFVIQREGSYVTIRKIAEEKKPPKPEYAPVYEQQVQAYAAPVHDQAAAGGIYTPPMQEQPKPAPKKKIRKILTAIAAVIVVVCIAVGGYVYTNTDTKFDDGNRKGLTRIRAYKYHKNDPTDEMYQVVDGTYGIKLEATDFLPEPSFFTNDMVIIFFDDDISVRKKKKIMDKYGIGILAQCDTLNQVQLYVGKKNLEDLEKICEDLEKEEGILFATTDELYPIFPFGYGSTNDTWNGEPRNAWWYEEMIHASQAWQSADDMKTVKVGIYDDGLYADHEDLKNKISCLHKEDEDVSESDYQRSGAHATHVAGIIGAEHNNGLGIAGVAPNAEMLFNYANRDNIDIDFKLFDIDIFSVKLQYQSQFGWYYHTMELLKEDCRVINISMGRSCDYENDPSQMDIIDQEGYYASFFISRMLDKGYDFIICQAAGNDDRDSINAGSYAAITEDNCYTEKRDYDDIISHIMIVGAISAVMEENGEASELGLANFSNYGKHVSICAPGTSIYSCIHPYGYTDGYYTYYDGTSMATPIVSGVCAMVWGTDPDLSAQEVKSIICDEKNTVYNTSWENINYKVVDAGKAVLAAKSN